MRPPVPEANPEAARLVGFQRDAGNAAVVELLFGTAPVQRRAGPGDDQPPAAGPAGAAPVAGPPGDVLPAEAAPLEDIPVPDAAPAKERREVKKLRQTHVLDPSEVASVPDPGTVAGLRTEWRELKARNDEVKDGGTPLTKEESDRWAEVKRLLSLSHRSDAEKTLAGNGYRDGPAAWYADVKDTTFLGKSIRVHRLLADRLDAAEAAFLAKMAGKEPEGGWIESTSTLRGASESLHGLGLAIDLNPATNPYLINPSGNSEKLTGEPLKRSQAIRDVIDRAVLLVLGRSAKEEDFGSRPKLEDRAERVKASYDKLSGASEALQTYFGLTKDNEELERLVAELGEKDPRKRTVKRWKKTIREDRKTLRTAAGRKDWRNPTRGFIDLPFELVKALTDQGLEWLGDNTIGSGRDIMHFDMRGLGPIKKIYHAEKDRFTALE